MTKDRPILAEPVDGSVREFEVMVSQLAVCSHCGEQIGRVTLWVMDGLDQVGWIHWRTGWQPCEEPTRFSVERIDRVKRLAGRLQRANGWDTEADED